MLMNGKGKTTEQNFSSKTFLINLILWNQNLIYHLENEKYSWTYGNILSQSLKSYKTFHLFPHKIHSISFSMTQHYMFKGMPLFNEFPLGWKTYLKL